MIDISQSSRKRSMAFLSVSTWYYDKQQNIGLDILLVNDMERHSGFATLADSGICILQVWWNTRFVLTVLA